MYDIRDLKIGDIMVCGRQPNRQLFYIHNIDLNRKRIESSGIGERDGNVFLTNVVYGHFIDYLHRKKFHYSIN